MNARGQALIEAAALFLALSVLLGGLAGFTQWFAIRQKLLLAAKEGALLYSSGHWRRTEVEARMRNFLVTGAPALNPRGITVSLRPLSGFMAWLGQFDECVVTYAPPGGWHALLGAGRSVSERFVVKHAPPYWSSHASRAGPAVRYGE